MSRQWRSDDTPGQRWKYGFGKKGDGNLTVTSTIALPAAEANFNTVAAGSTNLTLSTASTFANNDLVILIQVMGTGVGAWELNKIVAGGGTTSITLERPTQNTYTNTGSPTAGTPGNAANGAGTWSRPVILEMKEYDTVTIGPGGTLNTPSVFNGVLGGIGGFFAKTFIQTAGTVNGAARGYRGGAGSAGPALSDCGGAGGEGGAGRSGNGGWTGDGGSISGQNPSGGGGAFNGTINGGNGLFGYMGGGGGGGQHNTGQGDESGGGGGGGGHYFGGGGGGAGTDSNGPGGAGGASNAATGGGGGGSLANGNGGSSGTNGANASTSPARGRGGASGQSGEGGAGSGSSGAGGAGGGGGGANTAVANTELQTIFMGGGGGGGGRDNRTGSDGGNGGQGGGIWFIFAETITISGGAITVNGGDGAGATARGGGGGGGAAGSVLFKCKNATFGTNLVTAVGGAGYDAFHGGQGGHGSRGIIHVDYSGSISGTTNPTLSSRFDPSIKPLGGSAAALLHFI